jgi:predicted double-glycine peptidase
MKTITLSVKDTLANRLSQLTPKELDSTLGILEMVLKDNRTLEEVIHDMQDQAEKNGLTDEELEKILKEL